MGQLFKFKFQTGSAASRPVTGKAADSGYTAARGTAQQQANRQTVAQISKTVSNSLNQQKSINEAQRKLAQTAKLTGGANIDNSATVIKNLQQTFSGANDSSKTQLDRTLQSKQGFGQNWTSPRSSVGNAIVSAVAGSSADWLNAAGTALKSDRKSGLAVDSGRVSAQATGNEWHNRAGSYFQNEADRVQKISNEAYTRGSSGLNDDQKLLYGTAIAGAKIAGDLAIGALTGGSATIPMAIRSFGSGAQQARQAGASENRQIAYGAANAAKEALTEKTFDGMARLYGRAAADDLVDAFARRIAKSDGGQAVVRGTVNTIGEGLEEVISDLADPALQSLYNGRTWRDNYRNLNANELWQNGAVGMLLGGFGGSVDVAKTGYGTANEAELSTPYSDALRKMQHSTPYADALSSAETAENQAANHAVQVRYQELERKFLDGSISPKEADELWRLERMRGQFGKLSERMDGTWETGKNPSAEWVQRENNNAAAKDESDYVAARFFEANGTKNLSPIIKRSTIKTQGGFECFPDGDPLKRNVQNVKPIEGFFDVAMHGESDAVCFGGRNRNMTARMLASVIRHSEGYTGQNIRLLSCSTGKREGDSPCFAEELATALGVTVQAPNLPLYISERGTFQVGKYGEGAFVEYKPNERRRLK